MLIDSFRAFQMMYLPMAYDEACQRGMAEAGAFPELIRYLIDTGNSLNLGAVSGMAPRDLGELMGNLAIEKLRGRALLECLGE